MKILLALFLCVVSLLGCMSNPNSEIIEFKNEVFEGFELDSTCNNDESLILIRDRTFDFGAIKKKGVSKLSIFFPYANIGNSKLVILKTDVSCGCLTVNHSKKPLKRGETGLIEVLVNVNSQRGVFNKTVFVKSNARNDVEVIRIKGVIE